MPIDPQKELLDRARSHHVAGLFQQAEQLYRQVLSQNPAHHEAVHLLGVLAHQVGRNDIALDLIRRSIAMLPASPDYHHNYAEVCIAEMLLTEAEQASRAAIAMAPKVGSYHSTLSRALREQGRVDDAIHAARNAVALDPDSAASLLNLANALGDARHFDEAFAVYDRALKINPDDAHTLTCLGTTQAETGQIPLAIETFSRALEKAEYPDAHWNRSLLRLLNGDFERGWPESEWRWKCSKFPSARLVTDKPQWNGAPAPGQTVLLFGEQGAGDTMQFIRYAPMVAERVGRTILVCANELKPLLRGVRGVDEVFGMDDPFPPFDQHVPLLTLPGIFKTDLTSIPQPGPYISADAAKVEQWRTRLPAGTDRKIGLVWAGRVSHPNDRNRSINLAQCAPLASVPGIQWISLQVGAGDSQTPPAGMKLTSFPGEIRDYSDTAGMIANLDLVISVDTSVVHLAGAMGKPVWVLLPFIPDWRWLMNRQDTPWYPSARLFRQSEIAQWEPVMQRIADELAGR